jgi:two-component system NarL family sensor kinase
VLFRIAQEALTNVERHAQASTIELSLERVANRVSLSIADDGVGFDTDDVAVHPKRGIGLRNMMERMEAIGGRLSVNSSSSGTSVVASIDLKE